MSLPLIVNGVEVGRAGTARLAARYHGEFKHRAFTGQLVFLCPVYVTVEEDRITDMAIDDATYLDPRCYVPLDDEPQLDLSTNGPLDEDPAVVREAWNNIFRHDRVWPAWRFGR